MQYSFSRIHFHLISISALQNITSKAPCSSLSARMTQLQSQALSCESGKTKLKIDLLGNFWQDWTNNKREFLVLHFGCGCLNLLSNPSLVSWYFLQLAWGSFLICEYWLTVVRGSVRPSQTLSWSSKLGAEPHLVTQDKSTQLLLSRKNVLFDRVWNSG